MKTRLSSKKPTGKICKVCDRKFILYNTYAEYASEIENKDQLLEFNQQLLDSKEAELNIIRVELPLVKIKLVESEKYLDGFDE